MSLEFPTISEMLDTPRPDRVILDGGVIKFINDGLTEYEIELTRCDTNAKLLGWIQHLAGKAWLTTTQVGLFVKIAAEQHNFDVDYNG